MKTKLIFIVILLILVFPTFSFFLGDKMYTFHDETQIVNLYHYFKSIDLGQFPPRWAVDMHFRYGSPFLSFNYQLPYYLGYLGHLAGLPLVVIFKWLMIVSILVGATGMFVAGAAITNSNLLGLFAAILYTYTPYQAIDHYVRGTLGEVFALALFPWIFLSGFSLLKKDKPVKIAILSLLLALLILSHQPAALLALPFFLLIFLPAALLAGKTKTIFSYLKSFLVALLLSVYYWLPLIFEKRDIIIGGPFNYIDHFPFIKQLVYSPWKYAGSNPFSGDTFSFQIGLVNLLVLSFALIYLVTSVFKKSKLTAEEWVFRFTFLVTLLAVFLMNIRSDFIWRSFGLLRQIQFPWRLLMFTTWFIPFLFLFSAANFPAKLIRPIIIALTAVVIFVNVGYFKPGMVTDRDDNYYQTILLPGSAEYTNFAEDYAPLPIEAVRPKILPEAKLTGTLESTITKIISDNPYHYLAKVENTAAETLTFHTFYYPGWIVTIDGFRAKIEPNRIGAITFPLSPGKHPVTISFVDTPLRLFSNIISLGSFVFISSYLIYYLFKHYVPPTA